MKGIPLNRVAFRADLAPLLGVSEGYVAKLVRPPTGAASEWFEKADFPRPFYTSPSGIDVWFIEDIERWCRSIRLKRTGLREKRFGAFLDRPEIVERVLGL